MDSKEEGVQFTQQKESVTLKVRFAQFKETAWPNKEGGAGGSCLKWFNLALSIILLVVGLVCVIMGIACHVKFYEPFNYIARAYVNIITIFIVAGIVMMIAGGLGIFCIVKKSYSSLMSCLIILAVLIILHFILGGLAFSYRSRADGLTKKAMIEGFEMYFQNTHAHEFMDWSQSKFKCCGYRGPGDYNFRGHSSSKAPPPSTHHGNITTTPQATNRTVAPTRRGSTTKAAQNTTAAGKTTAARNTTIALGTTTTAPGTTLPPSTTTSTPKTTKKMTTTEPTTTAEAKTSTTAKTTVHIIQGMAGQNFRQRGHGLPESCCSKTKASEPCSKRPHDLHKNGCYNGVDSYLKKIMCAIGAISFVMIGFELLHLITGALCSKAIKEESSYNKV